MSPAGGVGGSGSVAVATAAGSQNGTFGVNDFSDGRPIYTFSASMQIQIGGPNATWPRIADGFSFNVGADVPDMIPLPEDGAGRLRVTMDTWDSAGADNSPSIEVYLDGALLAFQAMDGVRDAGRPASGPFITDPATGLPMTLYSYETNTVEYHPLVVTLGTDGLLHVSWKNVDIFPGGVDVSNFQGEVGARFAVGGRTGGAWADHYVDDLNIQTFNAGPAVVIQDPVSQTIGQGSTATFIAAADGTPPYSYQWFRNGSPISGANGPVYTTPQVTPADQGAEYTVMVSNGLGSDTSAAGVITVVEDSTPPVVTAVVGSPSLTEITIFFNEVLNSVQPNQNEDVFNYAIEPFVPIIAASQSPDGTQITLTTGEQVADADYTLFLGGIVDVALNEMALTSVPFHSFATGPGVWFEDFNSGSLPPEVTTGGTAALVATGGINNSGVLSITDPVGSANGWFLVDASAINEGQPIRTFDMEFGVLIGGPGSNPANRPADGFSVSYGADVPNAALSEEGIGKLRVTFDTWDNNTTDTAPSLEVFYNNASIGLQPMAGVREAGREYAPEDFITDPATGQPMSLSTIDTTYAPVRIKLNADDTLDVWFKDVQIFTGLPVPGLSGLSGARFGFGARTGGAWGDHDVDNLLITTVIPGPPVIFSQPQDQIEGQGATATFSVGVDGSRPLSFQWRLNGSPIPGATGFSYTTGPLLPGNDGEVYDVVISNSAGTITSDPATLTVLPDSDPPFIVSVTGRPNLKFVEVAFNEELASGPFNPAEDTFSYTIPGLTVISATLIDDNTAVLLETSPQTAGNTYTLSAGGVTDVAGNEMVPQDVTFTTFQLPPFCFYSGFDDGVVPAGSAIFGSAAVAATGGVDDTGALVVTAAANDQNGSFVVNDTHEGELVTGFDAAFMMNIGGAGGTFPRIADGASFNFANDLPDQVAGAAEDGAGTGLRVTFDTWDSGGVDTAPAIDIVYNGVTLAARQFAGVRADARARTGMPPVTDPATGEDMTLYSEIGGGYYPVQIILNNDQTLDLWFKGVQIFDDVIVPWVPTANNKMVFAARTGGANAAHVLDEFFFCTTAEPADVDFAFAAQPQDVAFAEGCENLPALARFHSNFNSGLPAGVEVGGTATISATGGVGGSGMASITTHTPGGQNGVLIIRDFNGGLPVPSFAADFKVRLGDSTCCTDGPNIRPADGFSFNFAGGATTATLPGEEGVGNGLVVSFDTWDNNGTDSDPAISVKWNGAELAFVTMGEPRPGGGTATPIPVDPATGLPMTIYTGNSYAPVSIKLDSDGTVDVAYKGVLVLEDVATGYSPMAGDFFFGARTGGANESHFVDDLNIVILTGEASDALLDQNFAINNGGFTVENTGTLEAPWTYDGDSWSTSGSANQGAPSSSALVSPVLTIGEGGPATLSFNHSYSFEWDTVRWDGGQVQINVNGSGWTAVPAGAFSANGYAPSTIGGNNVLNGQFAFNGTSPNYGQAPASGPGLSVESVASLGNLNSGDTLQVRFLGAWDEFAQGAIPNWDITTVTIGVQAAENLVDVTAPGDTVVPSSANHPAGEPAPAAIDDNTGTKYLNFDKLNTGFTVTPSAGLSVVKGLGLVSANDAPDRDPTSFVLEGSLNGTDFTEIATGSIPAFAARFERKQVNFDNSAAYLQYRIIFPTVANEAGANSMQIAEVEFLGTVLGDVTLPGDPVVGSSGNHPGGEPPPAAIDDNTGTKYLNFDKLNTGFTVTPQVGASVLSGLSLTSANDAPERDPATYLLEGSNDGSTFAEIASGAVPAFSARFQKQYVTFANSASYNVYRLTFPTVANEAAANSMQIAEVEFLGEAAAISSGSFIATFSVDATATVGGRPDVTPSVQWQRNDGSGFMDIAGANEDSYSFAATPADDGAVFRAIVSAAGVSALSDEATVIFTAAPVVTISSPADGSVFPSRQSITLVAEANDSDGSIARVEFFANLGGSLGTGTADNGTYSRTVNGLTAGIYEITAVATDNDGASCASPAIYIEVLPNQPPVCIDLAVDVNEDESTDIALQATDPEGDLLTYAILSSPSHGTAVRSGNVVTYTPDPDYAGPDSFTYNATDFFGLSSDECTVSINVVCVNDAPTCAPVTSETCEDTAVDIALAGSDVDLIACSDTLSWVIVSGPANGSVSLSGNVATYTPGAEFSGTDGFTYAVVDAAGASSAPCPVSVTVIAGNDSPDPVILVAPQVDLGPSFPGINVVSPNNVGACVTLDASNSSDAEGDSLTYLWLVDGVPVGDTAVVSDLCLTVGDHEITLIVDDGTSATGPCDEASEASSTEIVSVLLGSQILEDLILIVDGSDIVSRKNKQQFFATLKNAAAATDRGSFGAAINMLEAFVNKVEAQLKDDPDTQAEWIRIAQEVINGLSTPVDCEGCIE